MLQNKKWVVQIGLALLALMLIAGCGNNEEANGTNDSSDTPPAEQSDGNEMNEVELTGEVIATYEGGEITDRDFHEFKGFQRMVMGTYYDQMAMFNPNFERSLVEQQIGLKVIAGRAEQFADEAAKKADEEITSVKQAFAEMGQEDAWEMTLEQTGTTEEAVRMHLTEQYMLYEYFAQQIDEKDVEKSYEDQIAMNPHAFDTATVRHILIGFDIVEERTKEEALEYAQEIRQQLLDGADFATLADEVSEDGGSTPPQGQGGLYVNVNVNQWVEGFKNAALELPLNEISEPIETEYGYHVLRVEDRYSPSFEDLRDQLAGQLTQPLINEFMMQELPDLILTNDVPEGESAFELEPAPEEEEE